MPSWLLGLASKGLSRLRRLRSTHRFLVVSSQDRVSGFVTDLDDPARMRFTRLILQAPSARISGHYFLRDRSRAAWSLRTRVGLVILHDPPLALRPHLLRVPRFVQFRLDLRRDARELLDSLPADRCQRIRRLEPEGFSAVVSRDAAWAEEFHDRFHQPAVRGSHGDEGYVMPVGELFQAVHSGGSEFLKIYLGSQCVAAGTCRQIGSVYHLERPGWLDGDPSWLRKGVQIARVWFAAERARALGCRDLMMGGTPPFLEDGVFRFKARWGARVDLEASVWGDHYLMLDPCSGTVRGFLDRCTMIVRADHGRLLVCSGRSAEAIDWPANLRPQIQGFLRLRSPQELTGRCRRNDVMGGCPADWFVEASLDVHR